MLRTTSAERLAELAADTGVSDDIGAVNRRLQTALKGTSWFDTRTGSPLRSVAYFSPEFGITEALPQYSGGLGVLAGDHLKAASDLGVPLVGVGLLYTEGYFRQRLDADGWQQESVADFDPKSLGLADTGVEVAVDLAGDAVPRPSVAGRRRPDPALPARHRRRRQLARRHAVTDRLYGGDEHHRLRQEIVLGIGGVRALRALGMQPEVFHMNEGHAGFLGLERIRELIAGGLPFAAAIEAVRGGGVFTTHTPVPAGIDRFPRELMEEYFGDFAAECGVTFDELFAARPSATTSPTDKFNMAVMALRLADRSNGVARLHGAVSRRDVPAAVARPAVDEVPIGSITNGVHGRTWASAARRRPARPASSARTGTAPTPSAGRARRATIDPIEAWATLNDGRDELRRLARQRLGADVLDPAASPIGFARRFATYKRATLLLSDAERLRALLLDADRPVQFVFAGKAHPADTPGKELIQRIEHFARQRRPAPPLRVPRRLRHLDRPGDVPRLRRVAEQAAPPARGVRHERDEGGPQRRPQLQHPRRLVGRGLRRRQRLGHRVGRRRPRPGPPRPARGRQPVRDPRAGDRPPLLRPRPRRHAAEWVAMVLDLGVARPAGDRGPDGARLHDGALRAGRGISIQLAVGRRQAGAELAAWRRRIAAAWDGVTVTAVDVEGSDLPAGASLHVTVGVDLAGLTPADVRVEAVHGPVGHDGEFRSTTTSALHLVGDRRYEGDVTISVAGAYGVTARSIPVHPDLASPFDMGRVTWAT